MKKQMFLAVMLSVVCFLSAKAQSWVKNYTADTPAVYLPHNIMAVSDSSYLLLGGFNGTNSTSFTMRIDSKGNVLNRNKTYLPVTTNTVYELPSKDFLVMGFDTLNKFNALLLNKEGGFKQRLPANDLPFRTFGSNIAKKNDSTYAIFQYRDDSISLVTFNPLKNLIYNKTFLRFTQSFSRTIVKTLKNGFICLINNNDGSVTELVKVNFEGQIISRNTYTPGISPNKFMKDAEDNLYFMTSNTLSKIGNNGSLLWQRSTVSKFLTNSNTRDFIQSRNADFQVLKNGEAVIVQNFYNITLFDVYSGYSLYKVAANGDSLWQRQFSIPSTPATLLSSFAIIPTYDANFLIGRSLSSFFSISTVGPQIIKTDGQIGNFPNAIIGKIGRNDNVNCVVNTNQTLVANILIEATKSTGFTYSGHADYLGNYTIYCDTGNYTVKPIISSGLYQACTPSVSKQILTVGATDTINFSLKSLVSCPNLTVDLVASGFRRCFNNNFYINYCNNGTVPAINAYVDIRLDSLVEFISATRPLTSQNRNVFRFNLGTIGIGECGNFNITGRVKCGDSTRLGQTLCNEAHIYPDSVCLPTGTFSGANLTVSGSCVGDSVQFIVRNIGTATSQNTRSVVLEDEVLFRFNINGLPPNAIFSKKYKANGSTYRMIVEQEPNHPNSQFPTAFVEGCGRNGNGGVSTGFGTSFGNDDATPSVSTLCRPIVGSFDPNDKQGFPTGYKTEHFIRQNQDLDYVIRFQNTGTDTAFLVVVRDTLSDVLDLPSIEFGGSSHAYEADIYGKNIVKFTFQNINLPDSFRNVAASQGFVKFRIKQKKDLSIGTKINNKAGIYFDFNDPIITNTTLHTVAKDVLITAIIEPNKMPNSLIINVSPNPFTEHATFELLENNKPFSSNFNALNFQLFDALGRLIRSEKITNARFDFNKNDLATGLYFFKIMDGGKVMGNGKLVVQ